MNFNKLDEYIDSLNKVGIPASELIVSLNGAPVYHKTAGFSDGDGKIKTTERDFYWLFSATKVITCIATMRLVEEGLISLDDPVSKYIPEYADVKVKSTGQPPKKPMLVRHLFAMTGGMSYDKNTENILNCRDKSTLGLVRAMAKDGLDFEPGTRFKYSLCHDVLAAICEVVTGMKYSKYLDTVLFKPLGITDMGFHPTEDDTKRFSAMYKYENGTGRSVLKKTENGFRLSEEYDSGGAGLFGTASEYIKIIEAVANGGVARNGYRVLSQESIDAFKENQLIDDALNDFAATHRFGYGWGLCGRVHINSDMSLSKSPVGEFGWDGAAGAYVLIDDKNKLAIIYLQHVVNCSYVYEVIHPRIRDLTYEAISGEKEGTQK